MDIINSINFRDASLQGCLFFVVFNPIFWNVVSRFEYYTHFLRNITKNNVLSCYIFASTIFTLGIIRNYFFEETLAKQEPAEYLDNAFAKSIGLVLLISGQVLVITSMYRLGVIGTYCGDYFGILMKDRVTKFPFNVCHNPMYRGSTLSFLGYSLFQAKALGLVISLLVHAVYEIVLRFEEPFTSYIYSSQPVSKRKE